MSGLRIRELVRKEFIQLFRDKKNRPLLIIAPLVQLIVFGYVVTTDVRDIRVGLMDESRTPESRRLIDAIDGNKTFRITNYLVHPADLDRLLLKRAVDLGVHIFAIGIQLAAPVILTIFILDLAFGLISRVAPQVNVFMLGFQLKPPVGTFIFLLTIPLLIERVIWLISKIVEEYAQLLFYLR